MNQINNSKNKLFPSLVESEGGEGSGAPLNGTNTTNGVPFQIAKSPINFASSRGEGDGSYISILIGGSEDSEQMVVGSLQRSPINTSSKMAEHFEQATNQLNKGNFSQALEKFNFCIASGYKVFDSKRLKAATLLFDNKYDSSAECYQELINQYQLRQEGYYGKALPLALIGRFDDINNLFETAMKINPNDWRCYFCKGYYKIKTKSYDTAFQLITKSINLNKNSNYAMAYIARAELFCLRRNFAGAHKDIYYARKAVRDNDNQKALMGFQVEMLEKNFDKYDEIIEKLNQIQLKGSLNTENRQQFEAFLVKSLSRSAVMNNIKLFENAVSRIKQLLQKEESIQLDSNLNPIPKQEPFCQCQWLKCAIF